MSDERDLYKDFVRTINPAYVPTATVLSGRQRRMDSFRTQLKNTIEQSKFG
jgi:hypothetical protein